MTYPLSSDVTPGQPTAAQQYNNLRADALTLGNASADSLTLAKYFSRHVENFVVTYLATNRLQVPYSVTTPATIMINGYLLQATANITLAAGQFSGAAATWYIFAVRMAGSTTFTLSVNTSAVEATDQRLVGECVWDGANIASVTCYFVYTPPTPEFPNPDYDSGWFAVTNATSYTKAHNIGANPRIVSLLYCSSTSGANVYPVTCVYNSSPIAGTYIPFYINSTNIVIQTGAGTSGACTLNATNAQSSSGYYRILAWK
jgi:hypothetical protein